MASGARDTRRLADRFATGDRVEIQFGGDVDARWWLGRVVAIQAPGVWVALRSGQRFYVTNTRHIRSRTPESS